MERSSKARAAVFMSGVIALFAGALTNGATAASAATIPPCLANNQAIDINDTQVETWEDAAHNQFHARAHVRGRVIAVFADATGHKHFSVQIGATSEDAVEIIYNLSFGALTNLAIGADVEACGDYITDPSSPDKAIVHWVHKSNSASHASGYVAINGDLYGQD